MPRFTHAGTAIRSLSLHRKRGTFLGLGLSFEHYLFLGLYALTLTQCYRTVGEPYAAAVAHDVARKAALAAASGAVAASSGLTE